MTDSRVAEWAEELYRAGDLRGCLEAARQGLAESGDSVPLLRLAGRCGSELGLPDGVAFLRRVVDLVPDDAGGWAQLGAALVDQGLLAEAAEALGQVLRFRPGDVQARVDLAHVSYAMGRQGEALELLAQASVDEPGQVAVVRSLVEMLRSAAQPTAALDSLRQFTDRTRDDPVILLDVAELQLAAGRLDDAFSTFRRVGEVDDQEHRIYAWHGMIQVEIRRERFRRALDLAIEATTLDRLQLTTDLLAFVAARLFGEGGRAAKPWEELQAALVAEQIEHRRFHLEALVA